MHIRLFKLLYNVVKIQSSHLVGGEWKIRPISHDRMDPMIQHMTRKTKSPAKIVRNGGPWLASPVLITSDFSLRGSWSEGLEFDAKMANELRLSCNVTAFLNLNKKLGMSLRFKPFSQTNWKETLKINKTTKPPVDMSLAVFWSWICGGIYQGRKMLGKSKKQT